MAFTDDERARIRHHLGYPSFASMSNGIQLGFPAASHPLFLVEQAFNRMMAGGEEAVRRDLCECESIEHQLSAARKRMSAAKIGEMEMNPREAHMLRGELEYWKNKLADDLGCPRNPYAQENAAGGSGINSRVVG